jgi:hypothetical protein
METPGVVHPGVDAPERADGHLHQPAAWPPSATSAANHSTSAPSARSSATMRAQLLGSLREQASTSRAPRFAASARGRQPDAAVRRP